MTHRNQFDRTPEEPRVIEQIEVYELSLDKEPNAFGERLELAEGPELPTVEELIAQEDDPEILADLIIIRDGLGTQICEHKVRDHRRAQHPNLKEQ